MTEEWRAVIGWEGWYEVSNLGRCRTIQRPAKSSRYNEAYPIILTPLLYHWRGAGKPHRPMAYHKIQLGTCDGTRKRRRKYLHRMIWEAFNGPIPSGFTINHLDANPSNNRLDNLELADRVRQYHHQADLRLNKKVPRIMTPNTIRELRRLRSEGWTYKTLAFHFGIVQSNVRWILSGRTWSHVT